METLDKFDWAILNELQRDGRLTNAELAQRVGLSAAPCWRRVRALEESGVIKGYRAEIAYSREHQLGLVMLINAESNVMNEMGTYFWSGMLTAIHQHERDAEQATE